MQENNSKSKTIHWLKIKVNSLKKNDQNQDENDSDESSGIVNSFIESDSEKQEKSEKDNISVKTESYKDYGKGQSIIKKCYNRRIRDKNNQRYMPVCGYNCFQAAKSLGLFNVGDNGKLTYSQLIKEC